MPNYLPSRPPSRGERLSAFQRTDSEKLGLRCRYNSHQLFTCPLHLPPALVSVASRSQNHTQINFGDDIELFPLRAASKQIKAASLGGVLGRVEILHIIPLGHIVLKDAAGVESPSTRQRHRCRPHPVRLSWGFHEQKAVSKLQPDRAILWESAEV